MRTSTKNPVVDALDLLKVLASYGAWVHPIFMSADEPPSMGIGGKDCIREREHEVAGYLIEHLEAVDAGWLFGPAQANGPARLAQAWARALLPATHELYVPLTAADQAAIDRFRAHEGDA